MMKQSVSRASCIINVFPREVVVVVVVVVAVSKLKYYKHNKTGTTLVIIADLNYTHDVLLLGHN